MESAHNYLRDCALTYARAGYSVLPLRGKIPRTRNGSHDATADEATIRAWWDKWPDANIGITLDGLVVVDIDPRNGGDVDALPHPLPDTCYARTGGGGLHYLYRARSGTRYPALLAKGIDQKTGRGAYIVVEPSSHASGNAYNWLDGTEPWAMQPAEAPEWVASSDIVTEKTKAPVIKIASRRRKWIMMNDDEIEPDMNLLTPRIDFNHWINEGLTPVEK